MYAGFGIYSVELFGGGLAITVFQGPSVFPAPTGGLGTESTHDSYLMGFHLCDISKCQFTGI